MSPAFQPGPLRLTYDPPGTVTCSTPEHASYATLTFVVRNTTVVDVPVAGLSITPRIGGDAGVSEDLTGVTCRPGPSTPWAIVGASGTWRAVPLPPATGVPANGHIELVLEHVLVNQNPSQGATVDIDERTYAQDGVTVQHAGTTVTFRKQSASAGSGGTTSPPVVSLSGPQAPVAVPGTARLEWSVRGAHALVLEPGPVEVPLLAGGKAETGWAELPLTAPTTYTLRALGRGGAASSSVQVGVAHG